MIQIIFKFKLVQVCIFILEIGKAKSQVYSEISYTAATQTPHIDNTI